MTHVWIVRTDAGVVVFAREDDARRQARIFGGMVERKLIERAGVTFVPIYDEWREQLEAVQS